jgi:hypothetical protein
VTDRNSAKDAGDRGGVEDKVSGPTCRSAGLMAGWINLTGTSGTLVGGNPWVPISLSNTSFAWYQ